MRSPAGTSWLDRAVGACCLILVGAVALYIAVSLIASILSPLLVIAGITICTAALLAYLRARNQSW